MTTPPPDDLTGLPHWARGRHGIHLSEVPTREGGRLPTFVVIGSAKCGTTALNQFLDGHPEIGMCPYKEPHFFSTDVIYARGLDWYRGLYADCREAKAYGEASTSYTRVPECPDTARRLHEAVPDAKLVYLVREPVSRTEADLLQGVKYARSVLGERHEIDLDAWVDQHPVVVHASEYIVQIKAYLQYFDRKSLLVLFQEDLKKQPGETLAKIFAHIGVDPSLQVASAARLNPTDEFVAGVRDEKTLSLLRRVPGYDLIKRALPQPLKDRVLAVGRRITGAPQGLAFSPTTRARLKRHFRPFNDELAEFVGRDLSRWNE
jgi:hypothetical protein